MGHSGRLIAVQYSESDYETEVGIEAEGLEYIE